MGMFDKDKEIGLILTSVFTEGEQFVIYGASIARDTIPTKYGEASQATLEVAKVVDGKPTARMTVNTVASAIVDKVREAEADDFPALVMWRKVPSNRGSGGSATVLQFLAAWGNGSERAALPAAARPEVSDDDIPF